MAKQPRSVTATETLGPVRVWTGVAFRGNSLRLLVLGAVALTAPVAQARPDGAGALRGRLLWATVNVCDTAGHPDGIGIRGSMPGSGRRRIVLFMRFRVQFRRRDGRWASIGAGGDSGYVPVGSGRARVREAGRTFTLTPPGPRRPPHVVRGVVTFEWRRDGIVLRRAQRRTEGGHPNTVGSDPPGFSAAICEIRR